MQVTSAPLSVSIFATQYAKITDDFAAKMKLNVAEEMEVQPDDRLQLDYDDDEEDNEVEVEVEEDEDFSFVCLNPNGSPISADEVFSNGQIRPIYPLFNRDLLFADAHDGDSESKKKTPSLRSPLRKVFIETRDASASASASASSSEDLEGASQGTYCEWSPATTTTQSSPELGKKSNSTGFSKLWRFRDLVHRSSSDGKDAFVFLNNPSAPSATTKSSKSKGEKKQNEKVTETEKKSSGGKGKQSVSRAHERYYVRNRGKEMDKRRSSYLPYRQDLVGFFTSVNGLTKNVHPF